MERNNNFDLIRLLAALQVVIWHALEHLDIQGMWVHPVYTILAYFPGVPIFFTVSGFLVYASMEKNYQAPRKYFANRFFRIYHGLWMCLIVTIMLFLSFNVIVGTELLDVKFWGWILGQLTFVQFYTPEILRQWGVGTPNGALWTIPVELQFYVLLYFMFLGFTKMKNNWYWLLLLLIVISLGFNFAIRMLPDDSLAKKLGVVTILPYLYQFLTGVGLYKFWKYLQPYIGNKFFSWLLLYGLYCGIISYQLHLYSPSYWPNFWGLLGNLLLSIMTISLAFSFKNFSENVLKGNDISYGVYIYHMLVINSFVALNAPANSYTLIAIVLLDCIVAYLSWIIIEKSALSLKRNYLPAAK